MCLCVQEKLRALTRTYEVPARGRRGLGYAVLDLLLLHAATCMRYMHGVACSVQKHHVFLKGRNGTPAA